MEFDTPCKIGSYIKGKTLEKDERFGVNGGGVIYLVNEKYNVLLKWKYWIVNSCLWC
jgi:hypothetical protein